MNKASGVTAKKAHMYSTKIVWSEKRQNVFPKIDGVDSACKRHVQDQLTINEFIKEFKLNPESCCSTCVERMKSLVNRGNDIRKQKLASNSN